MPVAKHHETGKYLNSRVQSHYSVRTASQGGPFPREKLNDISSHGKIPNGIEMETRPGHEDHRIVPVHVRARAIPQVYCTSGS